MTLALDLGNSALKAALFSSDAAPLPARFATDETDWPDAFARWLATFSPPDFVGLASVVPARESAVEGVLAGAGFPAPLRVHAGLALPIHIAYETPRTLGADRIAAAVAAWQQFGPGRALVVVDAGSAVTFEAVTRAGVYAGGAIAPGPRLLAAALARGTAQLPDFPFEPAPHAIGRSTREALQSGVVGGFLDSVAGTLARFQQALGGGAFVVATGGWGDWLAARLPIIGAVRPHLVLEGVRAIAEMPRR